jgi:hypothetical protein
MMSMPSGRKGWKMEKVENPTALQPRGKYFQHVARFSQRQPRRSRHDALPHAARCEHQLSARRTARAARGDIRDAGAAMRDRRGLLRLPEMSYFVAEF